MRLSTRPLPFVLILCAGLGGCQQGPEEHSASAGAATDEASCAPSTTPDRGIETGEPTTPAGTTSETERAPSDPSASPSTARTGAGTQAEAAKEEQDLPHVKRLVIASNVVEREPIEVSETSTDVPVVAFLELENQSPNDEAVVVTFEHESGKKVGFIELEVPKEMPRYRTWGRTRNIKDPGKWEAIIATKSGHELARRSFVVTG